MRFRGVDTDLRANVDRLIASVFSTFVSLDLFKYGRPLGPVWITVVLVDQVGNAAVNF